MWSDHRLLEDRVEYLSRLIFNTKVGFVSHKRHKHIVHFNCLCNKANTVAHNKKGCA